MINSTSGEKDPDTFSILHGKVPKKKKKLEIEGTHPSIIKPIYTKPIASSILNSENLKHLL